MTEEEVNARPARGGRASASARRSPAWRRSTSRRPPGPSCHIRAIVNAITFVARRGLQPLPAPAAHRSCATSSPRATASTPGRLILGNGAAELLSARHARADRAGPAAAQRPGPPTRSTRSWRAAPTAAPSPSPAASTRCSRRPREPARPRDRDRQPQRPHRRAARRRRAARGCSRACPTTSPSCSTSRSSSSPTPSPPNASLALLEEHPRLLVFRSFSKAWGLAGLRIGYAIGAPGAGELLAELEPDLGVSEVSQAGALEALRSCSELVERRVRTICEERAAADRRAARPRLRGHRQPGQLPVGRPPDARRRRAGRAPGAGRRARRRRRGARRAASRAHQHAPAAASERLLGALDKALRLAGGAGLAQQGAGGALEDLPPRAHALRARRRSA